MNTPTIFKLLLPTLLLPLVLLGGCADENPIGTTLDDTATLAVGLTAEPVLAKFDSADDGEDDVTAPDLASLELSFDALRLYPGPGQAFRGYGARGQDDEGDWGEIAFDEPVVVDLLALESSLVELIASAEIEAGSYRGVGLHLVDAVATTVDGVEISVVFPADHFELLRVMTRFTAADGTIEGLSLSIDLASTVHACDLNESELVLRPVIGNVGVGNDPRGWTGWNGESGPHGQSGSDEAGNGGGNDDSGNDDSGDGTCDGSGAGNGDGECDGEGPDDSEA